MLRKLKNFAPFHIRKRLVETLVLSKLDYCNVVFSAMPDYQLKRLQRVQNMCAGYVLSRYATVADLKELRWLPIKERLEYSIAKLAHKSIYSEDFPIKLKQHVVQPYSLRSLNASKLELASKLEIGTSKIKRHRFLINFLLNSETAVTLRSSRVKSKST